MKDTELRQERDRDFFETYKRGLDTQNFRNMHDAADWVRNQEARKYYLSSKSLVNYIGCIINGNHLPRLHPTTKEKVMHLYRLYQEFLVDNPNCNLSRERICEILVDEPAPKFYLGHDYAVKILQQQRREAFERMGWA